MIYILTSRCLNLFLIFTLIYCYYHFSRCCFLLGFIYDLAQLTQSLIVSYSFYLWMWMWSSWLPIKISPALTAITRVWVSSLRDSTSNWFFCESEENQRLHLFHRLVVAFTRNVRSHSLTKWKSTLFLKNWIDECNATKMILWKFRAISIRMMLHSVLCCCWSMKPNRNDMISVWFRVY